MSFKNIAIWNNKEVGGCYFVMQANELIHKYALQILVIVQPKINGHNVKVVTKKVNMDGCYKRNPKEHL